MTLTAELAEHFCDLQAGDLPPTQVHVMRRLLLDYFAVGLAGSESESGRIASQFVVDLGGQPQATVIGHRKQIPAVHAAFANAVAEHSLELDDVDDLAYFHFGPPVVSAALAVAEWQHSSGGDLLTSMMLGCDMMDRLSRACNPALRDRGFHTTPTCGVFGATVASARLLGLTAEQMTNALGLAGAQASGLMEMYGPSMQKRFNAGPAARNGITAAMLAEIGFTGADSVLEGERGFGTAFAGELNPRPLAPGQGPSFAFTVEFKPYSAARPIHNAIDCALELRSLANISIDEIESIVVYRHPDWSKFHANRRPTNFHEAQVSLPFSVAVSLIEGVALPAQYTEDYFRRPDVSELIDKISIATDDTLRRGVSCRMLVVFRDQSRYEVEVDNPKGSVGNPLSDRELEDKFVGLVTPVLGAGRARGLSDMIWSIDDLTDAGELLRATIR